MNTTNSNPSPTSTHSSPKRLWLLLFAALLGCFFTGCAAPANVGAMVPKNLAIGKRFNKSLGIAVTGGQSTNPMWCSQVANEDFASALQQTIEQTGLFSSVLRSSGGEYQLDVRLIRLRQPMIGFDMTVQAEVEWRLRHGSPDRVVWEGNTNRSFTATVGDAFVGMTRLKMANEGAIREAIKAGLEQIAALSL